MVRVARAPQQEEDKRMIHIPNPSLGRRGLIAGTAGLLAAAPGPVPAHAGAPPTAARQAGGGGDSAAIDVNHARSAPIPIAIPDLGGGQLGQQMAGVISADLARSG